MKTLLTLLLLVATANINAATVTNINAFYRDGQVFITWDNIATTGVVYTVYRSPNPIRYGYQLLSAQNLGFVRDNSALNKRLTDLSGGTPKYLKIDSSSAPLGSDKGLFVATSTAAGSFYYAVTTSVLGVEDTAITTGANALASPVIENVVMPRPVWQENRLIGSRTYEIYIQFVTKVTSPIYPLMANVGSYPFHFAIVKSGAASIHPVSFWMHGDGRNFLSVSDKLIVGDPNEWVVTIDDWLPDGSSLTTCYYGYHENYDIYSSTHQVPTSGIVYDYTFARVKHTINWAIRNLPVDSTRTYIFGYSAGAIGGLLSSLMIPSKIAAIAVIAPQCDMATFALPSDNQRWGTVQSNLATNDGYRRNERLSANALARIDKLNSLPILFTFCGKYDVDVGWPEKIPFYDTLNFYRHGGFHFWSLTDHGLVLTNSPWLLSFPNFSFFTRYRTNLSYPSFTNCSFNDNPGNGTPSDGDPIGSINGHIDWNDNILDVANKWEISLKLKDLSTLWAGSDVAPDSGTTDVTLRRLQAFRVPQRSTISWENRRNNIVVQRGSFSYDSGLVTIPGVRVYKDSSRLTVTYSPVSIAEQYSPPREFVLLQNYPNPFNPSTTITYELPQTSHVSLSVYNVLGLEVATLVNQEEPAGAYTVQFNGRGLSSGVYFYRLQAGEFTQTKKLLLVR